MTLTFKNESDIEQLADAMIAVVIGHEASHLWRRDADNTGVFTSVFAESRAKEKAADTIGFKIAEAAGFRPEGEYLLHVYLAGDEIKNKGRIKAADTHPTIKARAEKAYSRMHVSLKQRGLTPLVPLPEPGIIDKQYNSVTAKLRRVFMTLRKQLPI